MGAENEMKAGFMTKDKERFSQNPCTPSINHQSINHQFTNPLITISTDYSGLWTMDYGLLFH